MQCIYFQWIILYFLCLIIDLFILFSLAGSHILVVWLTATLSLLSDSLVAAPAGVPVSVYSIFLKSEFVFNEIIANYNFIMQMNEL